VIRAECVDGAVGQRGNDCVAIASARSGGVKRIWLLKKPMSMSVSDT
jgi:hypothetical protein